MSPLKDVLHAFPAPAYLRMPGAGIDISSNSMRSVFLDHKHGKPEVSIRKVSMPQGAVVSGEIEKPDVVADFLRSFRLREHIHFAHASLSERKAFLYQTLIPSSESNLRSAVEFSLEEHVPIPPAEALFDFEVVRKVDEGTIVSVTVYASRVVESYLDVFREAGVTLLSLEVESHAAARAIVAPHHKDTAVMVVDFGRDTTRLIVIDHGVVSFTTTVEVGGDALTKAVMKHYNVSEAEAETIKNERGFLESNETRELYEALMTTVSVVKDDVLGHITYWNTNAEEGIARTPISEVVMIGGNANLKGLPEFLSRSLNLPVSVGNVWQNAFSFDEYIPSIPHHESLEYANTVGLALRSYTRL